jgi:hypothetical protein
MMMVFTMIVIKMKMLIIIMLKMVIKVCGNYDAIVDEL